MTPGLDRQASATYSSPQHRHRNSSLSSPSAIPLATHQPFTSPYTLPHPSTRLLDLQQLEIKHQRRIRRYLPVLLAAVCQVCGHGDAPLAADGHAGYADVPAFDDLVCAELEGEGGAFFVGCIVGGSG